MKKQLVLLLVLVFARAQQQQCDQATQFFYQGNCLLKSCINDKLARIDLIPLTTLDTNVGALSMGITYNVEIIKQADATAYQVTMLYGDNAQDQIVSDPQNCVDWRLYQNNNAFNVDPSRREVTQDGQLASWPQAQYSFQASVSAAQIQFNVTQQDLNTRQCQVFSYLDATQYECFFELAFVVNGVTQASYYFSFIVNIQAAIIANNVPPVQFVKIIQVQRCNGETTCQVNVIVPTSLWFCSDSTCNSIQQQPYFLLYLNRQFYMRHRIDDAAFSSSWFIENVILTYQSFNFQEQLSESEFDITSRQLGYNIYLLRVPIVAQDVLITAFGSLRQQGATLLTINAPTAAASSRTGQTVANPPPAVIVSNDQSAAVIQSNVQAAAEQVNVQSNQQQSSSDQSSSLVIQAADLASATQAAVEAGQALAAARQAAQQNQQQQAARLEQIRGSRVGSDDASAEVIAASDVAAQVTSNQVSSDQASSDQAANNQVNIQVASDQAANNQVSSNQASNDQAANIQISNDQAANLIQSNQASSNQAQSNQASISNQQINVQSLPQSGQANLRQSTQQALNINNAACDLSQNFQYQGQCLSKACINNKLSRIDLIPLETFDTNVGALSLGITYQAQALLVNSATQYQITILWGDIQNNQIVSDPNNCIDWRIYQNANAYNVNSQRLWQASEGAVPSWPLAQYQFNQASSAGQIQFNVSQAELDTRQCISFSYQDQTQWECFFELAYVIQGVTQASYYFSFVVTISASTIANNVPAVQFVKIIQVERCNGQSFCQVNVTVPTSLWFCSDSSCSNLSQQPFFLLYINRLFYMKHRIDDASFSSSWFIQNVILTYQSFNFQEQLNETEFQITSRQLGYNIYLLQVPIVAQDVLITAFGTLRQQGASLLSETSAVASQRTGQVTAVPAPIVVAPAARQAAQVSAEGSQQLINGANAHAQTVAGPASVSNRQAPPVNANVNVAVPRAARVGDDAAAIQVGDNAANGNANVAVVSNNAASNNAASNNAANLVSGSISGNANVANANGCSQADSFTYQGQCVPRSCLANKLSRMQLTPLDQFTTNIGKLQLSIAYQANAVQTASGYNYNVQILYGDQANNQLVSDPINCLDWRIYQTRNAFNIDSTRLNVNGEGAVPSWPASTYQFNAQSSSGQLDFTFSQNDLDGQQCIKLSANGLTSWECYFELAFIVKQITQVSYYFSVRIVLNTGINSQSPPAVQFTKIIDIEQCQASQSSCEVQINVNSNLLFCQDATCANIAPTPFFLLYLNRQFWMIHQITDIAFQNWYINNVAIAYQSFGFQLTLAASDYQILQHVQGKNIYQMSVPIVAQDVLISASATLSESASRILQTSTDNNKIPVIHSQRNTGAVGESSQTAVNSSSPLILGVILLLALLM